MTTFLAWFSQILLLVLGIFLMIIVLLQRGRGGGLAGAFGGMGGQSAFGSKAGDVFTRITIVVAVLWVVVSGGSGFFLRAAAEQEGQTRLESELPEEDEGDGDATGADGPVIPPQPPQPPADSTTAPESTDVPRDAADPAAGETPAAEGDNAGPASDVGADTPADPTPPEQN